MSYTPHTWTTGETITAAKLNNLEEGASSGGNGPEIVIIYYPNSEVGYQALGDFSSCLAKIQEGIPIMAYYYYYDASSVGLTTGMEYTLTVTYDSNFPNKIDLMISGGVGYEWTANGVTYFD